MRASHKARPAQAKLELQLGPLIDAVFLLLTYFVFTISLSTVEGLLPSELALGEDRKEQDVTDPKKETIVRLVQTGEQVQFFIDDWPVSDAGAVRDHLASLSKDSMIVIDAGPNVVYDYVIGLYNTCLKLELRQVVFPISTGGAMPGAAPRS